MTFGARQAAHTPSNFTSLLEYELNWGKIELTEKQQYIAMLKCFNYRD